MRNTTHTQFATQIAIRLATAAVITITGSRYHQHPAAALICIATITATALVTFSYYHEKLCGRWFGWTVYGLFDKQGDIIYIGSTNNLERRTIEHIEDTTEPWKRNIWGVYPLRRCFSEKQARRIEERRIKALTRAVEKNWAKVIHNDLHARPTDNTLIRAWRTCTAILYRAETWIVPSIRWIDNLHAYPARPDTDDDTLYDNDPDPVDPDAGTPPRQYRHPTEATYQRPDRTRPHDGWTARVPLLELSPVTLSPCPHNSTPVGGAPVGEGTGDKGTTQVRGHGTLSDRIREASERHAAAVNPNRRRAARQATTGGGLTAEQRAAKKTWDEREKKRKQRAKQAGEDYAKQPWPGDLPS